MKTAIGGMILLYGAIILGIIGWVVNLVKVIGLFVHSAPIDAMFIGRVIGVPVGILGAVLGWF